MKRNPMVLCPNGAQGDSPGQSEALVVPTIADRCIEEAFEASCGGVDPQFGEDFARDVSKHRQISTARRAKTKPSLPDAPASAERAGGWT